MDDYNFSISSDKPAIVKKNEVDCHACFYLATK